MKYEITVERLDEPTSESSYRNATKIYTQQVDDIDLVAVIQAVNAKPSDRHLQAEAGL